MLNEGNASLQGILDALCALGGCLVDSGGDLFDGEL